MIHSWTAPLSSNISSNQAHHHIFHFIWSLHVCLCVFMYGSDCLYLWYSTWSFLTVEMFFMNCRLCVSLSRRTRGGADLSKNSFLKIISLPKYCIYTADNSSYLRRCTIRGLRGMISTAERPCRHNPAISSSPGRYQLGHSFIFMFFFFFLSPLFLRRTRERLGGGGGGGALQKL